MIDLSKGQKPAFMDPKSFNQARFDANSPTKRPEAMDKVDYTNVVHATVQIVLQYVNSFDSWPRYPPLVFIIVTGLGSGLLQG